MKADSIMYRGDKENSNADSSLISTKRSLVYNELNKKMYKSSFLNEEELEACRDGYIYVHDMAARRDTMNCCLFDIEEVLSGGFEMGNIWYNEPKSLDTAFDVMGDIILSAASQQYGGFTIPSVENILEPYAERSYKKYTDKYVSISVVLLQLLQLLQFNSGPVLVHNTAGRRGKNRNFQFFSSLLEKFVLLRAQIKREKK